MITSLYFKVLHEFIIQTLAQVLISAEMHIVPKVNLPNCLVIL